MEACSHPQSLISVIVPTRNPGRRFLDVLAAIEGQHKGSVELIVVDDGSDPPIEEWLLSAGPTVRCLRVYGAGPSGARNAGLAIARSEWTAFVDDDDVVSSNWAAVMASAMRPDVDLIAARARLLSEAGEVLGEWTPIPSSNTTSVCEISLLAGTFCVRTSLARQLGGYDELLRFSENTDFGWRVRTSSISRNTEVMQLDEIVIDIYRRPQKNRRSGFDDLVTASERMLTKHDATMRQFPKLKSSYHAVAGVNSARLRRWRNARRHFVSAVRTEPRATRSWLRLVLSSIPLARNRIWSTEADNDPLASKKVFSSRLSR